jgi:PAS domain S-box-containing protein
LLDEMAGLRSFDDLILSTMTSGLLVADESGKIVNSNARAARILGSDPASLEGRGLAELFASSPRALEAIQAAMQPLEPPARGPACSLPVHAPVVLPETAHGSERLLDLSVSALDSIERGRLRRSRRHYLVSFADVTEHLRLLQEDERRARLAAIGEITAKLGHEIRNSLGGLRLYVENVREEIDPNTSAVRTIDSMVEEIESLYRKIDELREYARDPILERSDCDLKDVVEEALAFAGRKLREKHIQVFIESEPRLEPVRVDRRQIRDAFQNLINNAVEAAPPGGMLRIGIERSLGANGVPAGSSIVHFEDNGPGIPEEIGDQVFSLFFTTKPEAGTGLGLPIVKKIVESHGGRLAYISRPGSTRFTVALPPARHGEGST